MKITNRTVHHECTPQETTDQIKLEELGNGSVVTCEDCGQHWGVSRDSEGITFVPITRRHKFVLWMFGGTAAYEFIMRQWWPLIDRGGYF